MRVVSFGTRSRRREPHPTYRIATLTVYQVLALVGMAAFVIYLFRGQSSRSRPRRSASQAGRTGSSLRPMPAEPPRTYEVEKLHQELLALVYGDEQLLKRLVDYERRTHPTREACYRAAIDRLLRDRLN